jgi:peptidoglycan hydrolase CwlO-like protein
MWKKFDTKTIIIMILAVLVIILMITNSKNNIYGYKKEIKELHEKNTKLRYKYDSLVVDNKRIDAELDKIYGVINITEKLVEQYDNRIKELKESKNETSNRVNVLNADGVASEFTNYIKKRGSKNIRK